MFYCFCFEFFFILFIWCRVKSVVILHLFNSKHLLSMFSFQMCLTFKWMCWKWTKHQHKFSFLNQKWVLLSLFLLSISVFRNNRCWCFHFGFETCNKRGRKLHINERITWSAKKCIRRIFLFGDFLTNKVITRMNNVATVGVIILFGYKKKSKIWNETWNHKKKIEWNRSLNLLLFWWSFSFSFFLLFLVPETRHPNNYEKKIRNKNKFLMNRGKRKRKFPNK